MVNGAPATRMTTAIRTLAGMPVARAPILRQNRPFIQSRANNEEAWLGTQAGAVATPPCAPCARGIGPFTVCVIVDGLFRHSCANCHYGGNGTRCSFRQSKFDSTLSPWIWNFYPYKADNYDVKIMTML
jgi:hypothetical protein